MSVADLLFPKLSDSMLGSMRYAWGRWTGESANLFGHEKVRVRVPGTLRELEPRVRPLLEQVASAYPQLKKELLAELYEEFDSARAEIVDETTPEAIRSTTDPAALWPYVTLVRVWVDAYGVKGDVELAYELGWDPEHTRGLTVRDGKREDYCGSVAGW